MKTDLHRASNLKFTILFWPQFQGGSKFLVIKNDYVHLGGVWQILAYD